MTGDPTVTLDELDRLNRERTQGEWELWTGCSWRRFGSNATGKTVIEPTTYSATDNHPDLHFNNPADPKFVVALANACDPAGFDLLGRVRKLVAAEAERDRLRTRLLSAAGDDLCRLTQEEIKAYTSGAVQIPPEEEFIPSCRKFWKQTADKSGVLEGCLTMAQLIAENERLWADLQKHLDFEAEIDAIEEVPISDAQAEAIADNVIAVCTIGKLEAERDRLTTMLVDAAATMLGGMEWEDHHAAHELAERLACPLFDAYCLMAKMLVKYPHMPIVITKQGGEEARLAQENSR